MAKERYHETVAATVIRKLEEGTAPWIVPWKPGEEPSRPVNALTGKEYRGVNSLFLSMVQPDGDPRWCTLRQANRLDARIRKGARGEVVQYWKYSEREPVVGEDGEPVLDADGKRQYRERQLERPKVMHAVVFHASAIEGLPEYEAPAGREREWEPVEAAERIVGNSGAAVKHDQRDRAFYRPATDSIHLPEQGQFGSAEAYYRTALHELGHWTGHESRLARDFGPHGSESYAREELRAEIASYMLGTELGIGHDESQAVSYVASWVKLLKDQPAEILAAARDADRIKGYLGELVRERAQEREKERGNVAEGKEPHGAAEKTYINLPFAANEEGKELGAQWDRRARKWFIPEGVDAAPFAKWMGRDGAALAPDAERSFSDFLAAAGLKLDGPPALDGEMHRVPVDGGKPGKVDGMYMGHAGADGSPVGGYAKNWKTGEEHRWRAENGRRLSAAERREQKAQVEKDKAARHAKREAGYREQALAARHELGGMRLADRDHPYLQAKGLYRLKVRHLGLRQDEKGNLVVPLEDAAGRLWSYQRIGENGFKSMMKGGRVSGCFAQLSFGKDNPGRPLLIATGWGTGAVLHLATAKPVVCAMSDANLLTVAQAMRDKYPDRTIAICGDDDEHLQEKNLPNAGAEKAREAAEAVGGIVILPAFEGGPSKARTDFADVARVNAGRNPDRPAWEAGFAAVGRQIGEALEREWNRLRNENARGWPTGERPARTAKEHGAAHGKRTSLELG